MTYFAGIDGGQSKTDAVIADQTGKILGRGSAGPADEIAQGPESTRLRDALRDALAAAAAAAGLPSGARLRSAVAGVSGYEGRVYGMQPELPADAFELVHDSENAHAGALAGEPGVIVIAGTGSVAFARGSEGRTALAGGWGYLFGDEGSAFWLAREAVSDAMRDADAGAENALAQLALAHFGVPSLRKLARSFYTNEISRTRFASFATAVLQTAESGDQHALEYARDGAGALVALAMRALQHAGISLASKVAFIGGMMKSAAFSREVAGWMREILPDAQYVPARYDPAVGSLILAYRAAGVRIPEEIA